MSGATMNATDSVYGSLAEAFFTLSGKRYSLANMIDFESKYEMNIVEVPILGKVNKGHKMAGGKGTWKATVHFNQSALRALMYEYQTTGKLPYFDIQTTNEDPASSVGRQTVIHIDCLLDAIVLSKIDANEAVLEEEMSGTFERWEIPEKFNPLAGTTG